MPYSVFYWLNNLLFAIFWLCTSSLGFLRRLVFRLVKIVEVFNGDIFDRLVVDITVIMEVIVVDGGKFFGDGRAGLEEGEMIWKDKIILTTENLVETKNFRPE